MSSSWTRRPIDNGFTNAWHRTRVLADVLTMHDASGQLDDAWAFR